MMYQETKEELQRLRKTVFVCIILVINFGLRVQRIHIVIQNLGTERRFDIYARI